MTVDTAVTEALMDVTQRLDSVPVESPRTLLSRVLAHGYSEHLTYDAAVMMAAQAVALVVAVGQRDLLDVSSGGDT